MLSRTALGKLSGQLVLFVEGQDDKEIWTAWLRKVPDGDRVDVFAQGGDQTINVAYAAKTLHQMGLTDRIPFVLALDSKDSLPGGLPSWFDDGEYYVWDERDITAYLLSDAQALEKVLKIAPDHIQEILSTTTSSPKGKWTELIRVAGKQDSAALKGLVAAEMAAIPVELERGVVGRIRDQLTALANGN